MQHKVLYFLKISTPTEGHPTDGAGALLGCHTFDS